MTTQIEYTRQLDWFSPADNPDAHVTIVGVGGIGSFTAMALAKLGVPKLTLVDFDEVEAHNLPNQMFMPTHLGVEKVEAMEHFIDITNPDVEVERIVGPLGDGITTGTRPAGVIVSGLDSMAARADLWGQLKYETAVPLYLDARLAGQQVILYGACPSQYDDIQGYEATLHSDEEGLDTACTARAVIDVGFAVASLITRAVRRHYAGLPVERVAWLDQESLVIRTQEQYA